jgi:sialate O-acetylesterase
MPAKFFNGKICGLSPLKPAGVLWYQGCSNDSEPYEYGDLVKLMVTSWRRFFRTDFPFYYVELAAINDPQNEPVQRWSWGGIREAQAEVLSLPKTGVITSADAGGSDMLGPGDIHPPCKKMIAERAAKLVLAEVYGKGSAVAARSPYYSGVSKAEGGKFRVKIANADGLRLMSGKTKIDGFAIRGEKKDDWKWANAELKGDEIILSSPEVPEPKAVRYGWARRPRLTLESAHGLPLRPFSTDHGSTLDYGK